MKVWRNSEGREFPQDDEGCAVLSDSRVFGGLMPELGYELVEKEPLVFEIIACGHVDSSAVALYHDKLIPGKTYRVTEVVE